MIILTNVRTLLRSDWIDAPGDVQAIAYLAIAVIWAAAIAYSVREYRKDKEHESVEAVEAELRERRPEEATPA